MFKKLKREIIRRVRGRVLIEDLVENGLILGNNVNIQCDVSIDVSHCWLIEIGDDVVIAPRVIILAHDASTIHSRATKIGQVKIGNKTFIGAGAIILPGVTIGSHVVVGAGCVVSKDIPDHSIVVGNPCNIVGNTIESEQRHEKNIRMSLKPVYKWPEWGVEGGITTKQKNKMKDDLKDTVGYLINDKFDS